MGRRTTRSGPAVAIAAAAALACAHAPAPHAAAPLPPAPDSAPSASAASASEIAAHVAQLEAAVRADRARLVELVATPRPDAALPLRDDPVLREIALRLPELEDALERWAAAGPSR